MDVLNIKALSVFTKIGVNDWEQRINQQLLIDITIPFDFDACNDQLQNTIDYDVLCQAVTHFVESKSFQLIETVANELATFMKQDFNVSAINIGVTKPHAIRNAGSVQVVVNR